MSIIRNNVTLIGNLGGDPEFQETSTGKKVARVSIATTYAYTNKEGKRIEDTQWHRLVAWGSTADFMNNYLSKGSSVGVLGRLIHQKFESKDGVERNYTEIVVQELKNFDKSGSESSLEV